MKKIFVVALTLCSILFATVTTLAYPPLLDNSVINQVCPVCGNTEKVTQNAGYDPYLAYIPCDIHSNCTVVQHCKDKEVYCKKLWCYYWFGIYRTVLSETHNSLNK